jgi:hypothetical protein
MPKKSILIVLLMLSAMLSACNFPLAFGDPEEVENAVAETVAALEAAEEAAVVPTLALAATSTPMPTNTPEPEEEEEVEEVEEPTKTPCYAAMAWDLTVPDNTEVAAGAKIDKGWTFRNVGYCSWESDFKIAFDSGDKMNGPDYKEIGETVEPNEEVEVVVVLYAPSEADTYRGNWVLQTDDGVDIGPVWVKVVVK